MAVSVADSCRDRLCPAHLWPETGPLAADCCRAWLPGLPVFCDQGDGSARCWRRPRRFAVDGAETGLVSWRAGKVAPRERTGVESLTAGAEHTNVSTGRSASIH